jgi:ribosomal protein S17E
MQNNNFSMRYFPLEMKKINSYIAGYLTYMKETRKLAD